MPLADRLLRLASVPHLYHAKWTDQIMAEAGRVLQKKFFNLMTLGGSRPGPARSESWGQRGKSAIQGKRNKASFSRSLGGQL